MQSVLGVDMTTIVVSVCTLFAVGLAGMLVAALRNRLLLVLAVRNVPRRPFQSALITLGLALATVIITTALNTGDTLSHTVRTLVAGSVGRADEVIVKPRRDPRRFGLDAAQSVANGTFLTGSLDYFEGSLADDLRGRLADEPRIAGISPAIVDQVIASGSGSGGAQGEIRLFALPPTYPPVFGTLAARDGAAILLGDAPPASIVLNEAASGLLGVGAGDALTVVFREQRLDLTVFAVVRNGDPGGIQATSFMPLDDLQRLSGLGTQVNEILIANQGTATMSVDLSQDVSRAVRPLLVDDATARRLHALLRSDAARTTITSLLPSLDGRVREQFEALLRELDTDAPTDTFKALISDPDVERRLLAAAARAGGGPSGAGRGLVDGP